MGQRGVQLYDAFPTRALALQYKRDYEASGLGKAFVTDMGAQAGRLRFGLFVTEARREKANPGRPHRFRACVRKVSRSLGRAGRAGDPKRICGKVIQRNPISVIGNPRRKKSLDTSRIAGVVYGRVIELRAQKIYAGQYQGQFFKHPFAAASQVEALAMTDGSILLRSKKGVRLWRES